jgi:hypothetical protein
MLSRACYAVGSMSHIHSTDTLRSIYFAYFHSILKYGIIFWGNLPTVKYLLCRRELLDLLLVSTSSSHRNLIMSLEILPLPCKYIFTLMNFAVNKQELFQINSAIETIFIQQLPTFHVFFFLKKCILCCHQNLQQSTIKSQSLTNKKNLK